MKVLLPILASVSLSVAAVDRAASQRSIDTINAVVADITTRARDLGVQVRNFTDLNGGLLILDATQDLQSTLEDGTQRILNESGVRGVDALQLTEPILSLRSTVTDTVQAVIDKESVFINTTTAPLVAPQLQAQLCGSRQFTNATKSRLPEGGLHAVADNLAAPIFAVLQRGIDVYMPYVSNDSEPVTCDTVDSTSVDGPEGAAVNLAANHFGMIVAVGLAVVMVV